MKSIVLSLVLLAASAGPLAAQDVVGGAASGAAEGATRGALIGGPHGAAAGAAIGAAHGAATEGLRDGRSAEDDGVRERRPGRVDDDPH